MPRRAAPLPPGAVPPTPLTHITDVIEAQGRRLDWLAERVGVSQGHLTHLLAGRRRLSEAHARAIADALGLPIEFVLRDPSGDGREEPIEATR